MIGRTNAISASGTSLSLVVTVTNGAVVKAVKGSRTVSGTSAGGSCTLRLPEAGTWSVSATLGAQTSNTVSVAVRDSYEVTLAFFSATITVNAPAGATVTCVKGATKYEQKSTGAALTFTVTETGAWVITATDGAQTASGTVNVVDGTTSYSLTLSFVSKTLNENSWDVIRQVSDRGEGKSYWSVGDRKADTISGTVGSYTFSGTHYYFIVDFDHNKAVESPSAHTITFQLGKSALSGGVDIGYCDSQYLNTGSSAAFRMNTSNSNSGGWTGSYMKKTIIPQFKNAVSAELRRNVKTVSVWSDNTGGGTTASSAVTASSEDFYLAAEFEYFGARSYANEAEKNHQTQLAYYAAGNNKIKYRNDATSTAVFVWLRSVFAGYSNGFCLVGTSGTANYGSAYCSFAFAPLFNL